MRERGEGSTGSWVGVVFVFCVDGGQGERVCSSCHSSGWALGKESFFTLTGGELK